MNEDALARLEALERHVAGYLPRPMQRRPNLYEQPAWVKAMVLAKREQKRDAAMMLFPTAAAKISVVGDIDQAMEMSVRNQLEAAQFATELHVTLDSRGGEFDAAIQIYRALRWHPAPVKQARLLHRCESAAVVVMLACDHRTAIPGTVITIHGCGDVPDLRDHWSVRRHIEAIRALAELDERMLNLMADRTGAQLATLAREAADEDSMSLERALEIGLIHAIEPETSL
jgi:ATP-dependent protease ClpP protease subunit